MPAYKAICWDLDGTLIDSEHVFEIALRKASAFYKLSVPEALPEGLAIADIWSQIPNKEAVLYEQWLKEITKLCAETLADDCLQPYAKYALEMIKQKNIPQSVVSNATRSQIIGNTTKTQIHSYFQHLVGRDDVTHGKPYPHSYLLSCSRHGFNPQECLAIEDTPLGSEAAKRAGLTVIACPTSRTKHLEFPHADHIIGDLRELINHFKD
jgi:HAD superfamily hydrolase (TIGR01509 family)